MHKPEGALPGAIRGRTWKFGDDVSTDLLAPGAYAVAPLEERKQHVLEALNPRFPQEARPGDILVAGRNFGCGSSRESAPEGLKALGLGCVVAESFARLFFRNAIAIGLPVLPCPGVAEAFEEGDMAEVLIPDAVVRNLRTGRVLKGKELPPEMLEVLAAGGIVPLLKAYSQRVRGF